MAQTYIGWLAFTSRKMRGMSLHRPPKPHVELLREPTESIPAREEEERHAAYYIQVIADLPTICSEQTRLLLLVLRSASSTIGRRRGAEEGQCQPRASGESRKNIRLYGWENLSSQTPASLPPPFSLIQHPPPIQKGRVFRYVLTLSLWVRTYLKTLPF